MLHSMAKIETGQTLARQLLTIHKTYIFMDMDRKDQNEKKDSRFDRLLDLERFIPVMSEEEVQRLAEGRTDFGRETIARWERMASDRKERTDAIFREAYKRQEELCRQRTVN